MSERIQDSISDGATGRDAQRLQGEIGELKSEMDSEFGRIHESLSKIQLSLPEKVVYKSVEEKAQAYWRRNIGLISRLLVVWALVSYVAGILMATTPMFRIGLLPFSFWFAQQGAIYTFIVLIWIYARQMDKLDREFDVNE